MQQICDNIRDCVYPWNHYYFIYPTAFFKLLGPGSMIIIKIKFYYHTIII